MTPQEAQQRYDNYLADYWGSEVCTHLRGIMAVFQYGTAVFVMILKFNRTIY